jgi:sialate O-acetylesterase
MIGFTLISKPQLPEILSDGMVLQQKNNVKIWGKAKSGSTVKVSTSWGIKAEKAVADSNGNWIVKIETPEASFTPHSITISDGEAVVLNNILIGEVWLASGQSNMEMPLNGFMHNPIKGANEVITNAGQYPAIRFVTIKKAQSFEPLETAEGKWQVCNPENAPQFSATAFFFAEALHNALNIPIGIIVSSWGGSRVEAWTNREIINTYADVNLDEETVNKIPEASRPLLMYNAMIHPITNYKVNGFIWYQGESNIGGYQVYAERLNNMVTLWRELWEDTDLPFYFTEIAPFEYGAGDWAAYLREAQFDAQKIISNSGMISTNDLVEEYEKYNIHPRNKTDVGKRLAYMALNRNYGFNHVATNGPEFVSMEIIDNKAIITFDHTPNGFNRIDDIIGFEIAGKDGVFVPAKARVNNLNVEVYHENISNPIAVRYCFRNFMIGNLANTRELPLVPFRSDKN